MISTDLVSHKEVTSTIAHAQSPLHEGHDPVEGVHVSPIHIVLKEENKKNI